MVPKTGFEPATSGPRPGALPPELLRQGQISIHAGRITDAGRAGRACRARSTEAMTERMKPGHLMKGAGYSPMSDLMVSCVSRPFSVIALGQDTSGNARVRPWFAVQSAARAA